MSYLDTIKDADGNLYLSLEDQKKEANISNKEINQKTLKF
jgi:hypothetical protein